MRTPERPFGAGTPRRGSRLLRVPAMGRTAAVRFRHTLIHPSALSRAESAAWRAALRVTCPLCHQPYYATTLRGLWFGDELDAVTRLVREHLARECPDHAHAFELSSAEDGHPRRA